MEFLLGKARPVVGRVIVWVRQPWLRNLPVVVVAGLLVWLFSERVAEIDLDAAARQMAVLSFGQWMLAGLAIIVSYGAIALYDMAALRQQGIFLPRRAALRIGFVATALAQFLGLGLATGSLVRWRMLGPDQHSIRRATLLTSNVSANFLCCAFFIAALASLILLKLDILHSFLAVMVMIGFSLIWLLCLIRPIRMPLVLHQILPRLRSLNRNIALTAVDLGFAALAFWILQPTGVALSLIEILPVFILATLAGLISGIPSGIGPFELVIFLMLPEADPAALLAAIIAFRVLYYVMPAGLAAVLLVLRELGWFVSAQIPTNIQPVNVSARLPKQLISLVETANRAEARLIHEGRFACLWGDQKTAAFLVAQSGNCLIAHADPLSKGGDQKALFDRFHQEARMRDLYPVIYKSSRQTTTMARATGLKTHAIALDGVVELQNIVFDKPDYRGLRRKISQVNRKNVKISIVTTELLPLAEMTRCAESWVKAHGGERGFSMGCFRPEPPFAHQFILARQDGELVGFLGLWVTKGEVCVDLIRLDPKAAVGTSQALVMAGIEWAKSQNHERFSLAAVPFAINDSDKKTAVELFADWIYRHPRHGRDARGLHQFKSGFRPKWEVRYLASPNALATLAAGFDLYREIHTPHRHKQRKVLRTPSRQSLQHVLQRVRIR